MKPVWVNDSFSPLLATKVVREHGPRRGRLLTTRLDNDDALAREFVARTQVAAERIEAGWINFTNGVQLVGDALLLRSDPANAFISRVEAAGSPRLGTVFVDQHTRAHLYGHVHQVATRPMWMQVVHGDNIANRARGIRVNPDRALSRFSISVNLPSLSRREQIRSVLSGAVALIPHIARSPQRLAWAGRVAVAQVRPRMCKPH